MKWQCRLRWVPKSLTIGIQWTSNNVNAGGSEIYRYRSLWIMPLPMTALTFEGSDAPTITDYLEAS